MSTIPTTNPISLSDVAAHLRTNVYPPPTAQALRTQSADSDTPRILVVRVIKAAHDKIAQFHCGISHFEVETIYEQEQNRLVNLSVYLLSPGFGRIAVLKEQTISLLETKGIRVTVAGGLTEGTLKFFYKDGDVRMGWTMKAPSSRILEAKDGYPLFPSSFDAPFIASKIQNVLCLTDAEALALKNIPLSKVTIDVLQPFEETTEDQDFNEYLKGVHPTQEDTLHVASQANSSDEDRDFDLHLGQTLPLQFKGNINTSNLSVTADVSARIPLFGPVTIWYVKDRTIQNGLEEHINTPVANGRAKLYVTGEGEGEGNRKFWISLRLNVYGLSTVNDEVSVVRIKRIRCRGTQIIASW
ncbi:hypothetical protein BDN72DRAFT_844564 [Pluteus cervinus]|uniref:Uncharacterized protein n=1 Tax=Pluteus cervinus TaxID=181527 RepID=A0ACD3AK54_9AGAR|nr:hypothetical protein BDN72DRAFT_844564 [Pluteus cervinus]